MDREEVNKTCAMRGSADTRLSALQEGYNATDNLVSNWLENGASIIRTSSNRKLAGLPILYYSSLTIKFFLFLNFFTSFLSSTIFLSLSVSFSF